MLGAPTYSAKRQPVGGAHDMTAPVENCYLTRGPLAPALHLPERGSKEITPSLTRRVFLPGAGARFGKSAYIRRYISN